jgi:CheY-like chemotaxis protein
MARILVLEHDVSRQPLYERELGAEGHDIIIAASSAEADKYVRSFQPELIILDLKIENHDDGLHFLGGPNHIPTIVHAPYATIAWFFSHITHVNADMPFSPMAAEAFVVKSKDFSELKSAVAEVLAQEEPHFV